MEKFCDRLQAVAGIKKIFQADLARGTRKATSTVSKWWNGDIIPGPKNRREIAEFFGCEVNWLTTGEGPMFTTAEEKTKYSPNEIPSLEPLVEHSEYERQISTKVDTGGAQIGQHPHSEADLVHMCTTVFQSKGVYSTALASNALAFYTAVKNEEEMVAMREDHKETNRRIANLESIINKQNETIDRLVLLLEGGQKRDQKAG